MLFNSVTVFLGVLAAVLAADSSSTNSCSFDDKTITEAASVTQLGSCETLEGELEISGNGIGALELGGVKEIKGDIHIFNSSSVTNINLNSLEKISGSLKVDALTQLHGIDFSKLGEVHELDLVSLPSLSILNMNTGISKAGTISVSDTALSTLQGVITNFNTVGVLNVNNNKNISTIDLPSLATVSENLIISFNGDKAQIKLENLKWASNLTIQDVSSLDTPVLSAVNGSLILGYNKFEEFSLPVQKIGGALQVFANDDLAEFQLGNLTDVGGEVRIFNNTELDDMSDSFPNLKKIEGAVNIQGSFSNLTIPKLQEVDGDFTVQSDNDEFDCDEFKKLQQSKKIEGHNFKCVAPAKHNSASGSSGALETQTYSGSDGSDSSDDNESSTRSRSSSSRGDAAGLTTGGIFIFTFISTVFAVLI